MEANTEYLGCFPDYAYDNEKYQDDQYYNYQENQGSTIKVDLKDPALPHANRQFFRHFGDGPTRVIPSIDYENTPAQGLTLEEAKKRCYEKALAQGKKYFALQNGGLCMASNTKPATLKPLNDPRACRTCSKSCHHKSQPCGKICLPKRQEGKKVKCLKHNHGPCSAGSKQEQNQTEQAGGYFTNSLYQIKDLMQPTTVISQDDSQAQNKKAFLYTEPELKEALNCPIFEDNFFDLSPSQLFGPTQLRPDLPRKGLLLHQSAGSGKTCEGLNIAGNFFLAGWRVVWVTRRSLFNIPEEEMYQNICLDKLREIIDNPNRDILYADGRVAAHGRHQKITKIRNNIAMRGLLARRFNIDLRKKFLWTYDDFVQIIQNKGTARQRELSRLMRNNPNQDFGYQTLFIVDEADNLTNTTLSLDERQFLEQKITRLKLGGRRWTQRSDVYGPQVSRPQDPLTGRDTIPAMLHHSYQVSGANSARIVLMTATPTQIFWLLNLLTANPSERLPIDFEAYYDPAQNKLRPAPLLKFSAVVKDRLHYLDASNDPTRFARKIYSGTIRVELPRFQASRLAADWAIFSTGAKKRASRSNVSFWRNRQLCSQVTGTFYSPAQLKAYTQADDKQAAGEWSEVEQKRYYETHLPDAKKLFKMQLTATERQKYVKKEKAWKLWQAKRKMPAVLQGFVMADGSLVSEAQYKALAGTTANPQHFNQLKIYYQYWLSQNPQQKKKQGKTGIPQHFQPFLDEQQQFLSAEAWFQKIIYPKRARKAARKFTKKEQALQIFLILDPDRGYWRLKTWEEFKGSALPRPNLATSEAKTKFSFVPWHQSFKPALARQLLPYYAPLLNQVVSQILKLEKLYRQELHHGVKHTVFTFSLSEKGRENQYYGSRVVMAAFAAFPEKFELLLHYKKNKDGKVILQPKKYPNKIGVAVLSSRYIMHHQTKIEYNARTIAATCAAFNRESNKYGDEIKILILDGAFTEGVNTFDVGIAHFLNPGSSRAELIQAASRFTRNCKSKNLPFFKGGGSFLSMYFYEVWDPLTQKTLYQQMLETIPAQQQLQANLIDTFWNLNRQHAADFWLTKPLHEYNPLYKGKIMGYSATGQYVVSTKFTLMETQQEQMLTFTLDSEQVKTAGWLFVGARVANPDYRESDNLDDYIGTVKRYDQARDLWVVDFGNFEFYEPATALRAAEGEMVDFVIPNGVDTAQAVFNIGNYHHYKDLMAVETSSSSLVRSKKKNEISKMTVPQLDQVVKFHFRTQPFSMDSILLGLVAISQGLKMTHPFTFMLPPRHDFLKERPRFEQFGLVWTANKKLKGDKALVENFLSPRPGLTIMLLERQDKTVQFYDLLIFHSKLKLLERFSPQHTIFHDADSIALDGKLADLVSPTITYMKLAENTNLYHLNLLLQQHSDLEAPTLNLVSSLLYLQARLEYLDQLPDSFTEQQEGLVFPGEFQQQLMTVLKNQNLTLYLKRYARALLTGREQVYHHRNYDPKLPFWSNVVRLLNNDL